ncbi:MAG: lactonase family protein [Paludibacter sp.]|nr:lactonase family protein [Paludibacter sp.]
MKRILILSLFSIIFIQFHAQSTEYRLLIGTYTSNGKSEGIYSYKINVERGIFEKQSVAKEIKNPSFLALTADKKFLYVVGESDKASRAGAFAFNPKDATFRFINSSETKSKGPCYISASNKHVFTANYGGGSISVFGRQSDGALSELQQLIVHTGSSIHPERQTKPYVHQVLLTPDKKYLIANDLGTDIVTVYRYDENATTQVLTPHDSIKVKLGSGPRHMAISKDGKFAYLMQEVDGTVTAFSLKNGKLTILQETTVITPQSGDEARAADIHLSPDGKFVYATNRGTASNITCFAVGKDGKLTFVQQISSGGVGPRNFNLTPDGKYVFVANQNSDNIVVFQRDKKTGALTNTGKMMQVGAPVCLVFY